MRGIRIKDLVAAGYLALDLRDLLGVLSVAGERSQWLVSNVYATGPRSAELESLGDGPTRIPGTQLRELADAVHQVIDGDFTAFREGESEPWVIIQAVDSTYYEFYSTDPALLGRARAMFRDVAECEYQAE